MQDIAWTDDARARVYPSRARPNPAFLPAQITSLDAAQPWRFPLDADACYAKAQYYWARPSARDSRIGAMATTGVANSPPRWRDAVDRAIARCDRETPRGPLDVDVEAVTVALELCPVFAAMPLWLAAEGPAFALAALAACHRLDSFAKREGYIDARGTWIVETSGEEWHSPEYGDSAWLLLRGAIAAADDAAYARAHERADAIAVGAPAIVHAMLGFVFADEDRAAAPCAQAIAMVAGRKKIYAWDLARLLAVASLDDAVALARGNRAITEADLLTALDRHGGDAVRIIVAAIDGATNNGDRKRFAKVLLHVRTPAAATAFRRVGKIKALAPLAKQHAAAMRAQSTCQ